MATVISNGSNNFSNKGVIWRNNAHMHSQMCVKRDVDVKRHVNVN